jgi:hypothetical protein
MTDDEIMRQLSQAVRDDVLAAEEMVTTGLLCSVAGRGVDLGCGGG